MKNTNNVRKNATKTIPPVAKWKTARIIRDFRHYSENPKMNNEQGNPAIFARDLRPSVVLDLV